MRIHTLEVGAFMANCHLVWEDPAAVLVVDPGAEAARIAEALRVRQLRPAAVLLTHGHADHISALPGLLAEWPCPVYLSPLDAAWCFTDANEFPPYDPPRKAPDSLRPADEASALEAGGLSVETLPTPGHSPGSVCYRMRSAADPEGALFTGDTLFAGSIGRTDFEGGDMRAMGASLRRLAGLPETLAVHPGHGPATTIGREKAYNPFLEHFA